MIRKLNLLIVGVCFALLAKGQDIINPYAFSTGGGGGSITPPTFISKTETAWNSSTSPKTTASITGIQSGDKIVAYSIVEDHASQVTISSSPSETWTLQQEVNVTNFTRVSIWTTTASATGSMTVTFTRTSTVRFFGGAVLVFRGSAGFGASAQNHVSGATPSLTLTTTANNSAIVIVNGDWNATDGASRVYLTVNGITPTAGGSLETSYFRNTSNYALYAAYYSDAGTAGNKTVGLSAPTNQTYSLAALEVKGQ